MYNKVILVGRVTKDIELRKTQSGVDVCRFSVACDRPYSNNGERKADFISVVAWRNAATFAARYFGKGSPIGVEGRIETRDYTDRNGNERRAFEIMVDRLFFVGAKADGAKERTGHLEHVSGAYADGEFEEMHPDDDLPF